MKSASILLRVAALLLPAVSALPLERRAISADLLATFNLFEQFAAAAYCPDNNDSPDTKLTCSVGNCPLVEADTTSTVTEFENSLETDVTGYVATDSTRELIVVAFRGSSSIRNWIADIDFPFTDTDLCDGCRAASGFWTSWTEARTGVLAAVASAAAANPSYTVAVTGHSLGGAVAALAAGALRNAGYTVALYSFGAPRVGDETLSEYITAQAGGNYRITHLNDPVPKLPPLLLGYRHISPEYYISSGNNVTVTADDVEEYTGTINLSGNTGDLTFDTDAHSWYFNEIGACDDGEALEWKKRGVEVQWV